MTTPPPEPSDEARPDLDERPLEFHADPDRQEIDLLKPDKSTRVIIGFVVAALVVLGVMVLIATIVF